MNIDDADPRSTLFAFNKAIWGDRSWKKTLELCDPILSTSLAQQWLTPMLDKARADGFDADAVVASLAAGDQSHPLWADFERTMLRGFDSWPNLNTEEWAVGAHDRSVAPNIESLWLYDRRGQTGSMIHGDGDPYIPYLLKLGGNGWKVLNVWSDIVPVPGYPPTLR